MRRTNVRTLFIGRRRAIQIERDAKYPQMWRVRLPDGSPSDMRASAASMGDEYWQRRRRADVPCRAAGDAAMAVSTSL